jgi:hypothetical protein
MMSVFVDHTANMAAIDLQPGQPIASTAEVGASLLANYDSAGELVSVEILSLKAVRRPEVVAELHVLLGPLGELSEGCTFLGSPFLTVAPRPLNIVDLLIQQIDHATVEDNNAHEANALA